MPTLIPRTKTKNNAENSKKRSTKVFKYLKDRKGWTDKLKTEGITKKQAL